jgi:hypothetical protein
VAEVFGLSRFAVLKLYQWGNPAEFLPGIRPFSPLRRNGSSSQLRIRLQKRHMRSRDGQPPSRGGFGQLFAEDLQVIG